MRFSTATAILCLICSINPIGAEEAATLSFTAGQSGSFPGAIKPGKTIEVDLSGLAKNVAVYRAVLHPGRNESQARQLRNRPVKITLADSDQPLSFLAPRFTAFDVTKEVREALKRGDGKIVFEVHSFPGYQPEQSRLDVTCAAKSKTQLPRVTTIQAWHRAGQTFVTWKEVNPPLTAEQIMFREWKAVRSRMAAERKQVTYRIYRSTEPITPASIGKVEWVDEIGPLTCWNDEYYGVDSKDTDPLRRYVVKEGAEPVVPGTGIYVHNPKQAGMAFYAISLAINGEEDLSAFDSGNTTKEAVEESVGQGAPVLQRIEKPKSFNYVDQPTLHYFTRWEAPPNCNMPSTPYDYLVALPPRMKEPAPVGLHLHCWGGSLNGGYGWWYNAGRGAILISTNQIPYDWWTGYHENLGTWKSWSEGVVRDYSQTRLMSFLDWTAGRWEVDLNRVFTAGSSMGGSGAPSLGIRRGDRIAWTVSWVGVHTPARSSGFKGSYEAVFGLSDWKLNWQDGKTPAFTYFDDEWYLRQNPALETPLVCFANGKNDGGIGWPQARDFWKALQETRRPHVFVWGQEGHGQRALMPGRKLSEQELGVDIRVDQSLPAFTRCSLDGDPGNGDPKDGAAQGQSNLYLYWENDQSVDEENQWRMNLYLNAAAPKSDCTVDVTPRRRQRFKPKPGTKLVWTNGELASGTELQSGQAIVDRSGLVTVAGVKLSKGGNRLTIRIEK